MNEADNRRAVERLVEGLNAKDVSVMSEVFTDDSEMVYPQSGEAIRGRVNQQAVYTAIPGLPSIPPYRTIAAGDIVVTEAILDYGEDRYNTVFVFECREGKIVRETAYWSKPFPAAEWRSRRVEQSTPATQAAGRARGRLDTKLPPSGDEGSWRREVGGGAQLRLFVVNHSLAIVAMSFLSKTYSALRLV
ncbi:MAG TPA: nuclear transport factor 2 family protein, partial [Candidatus Limnocylindrales bacterium]